MRRGSRWSRKHAAVRRQPAAVEPAHHRTPAKAFKRQLRRGTVCVHGAAPSWTIRCCLSYLYHTFLPHAPTHGEISGLGLTPMCNPDHEDPQDPVLDADNDPVITHAVAPKAGDEPMPEQYADAAGVVQRRKAGCQEPRDSPSGRTTELAELLAGAVGEFNAPVQGCVLPRRADRCAPGLRAGRPGIARRDTGPRDRPDARAWHLERRTSWSAR